MTTACDSHVTLFKEETQELDLNHMPLQSGILLPIHTQQEMNMPHHTLHCCTRDVNTYNRKLIKFPVESNYNELVYREQWCPLTPGYAIHCIAMQVIES